MHAVPREGSLGKKALDSGLAAHLAVAGIRLVQEGAVLTDQSGGSELLQAGQLHAQGTAQLLYSEPCL